MTTLSTNYRDYQNIEASFTKQLAGILSLATEAQQQTNPNEQWIQLANSVLLSLLSYKPTNYRAYQYKLYLHLFGDYHHQQESRFASIEDCQTYFDLLLRVSFFLILDSKEISPLT